MANLSRETLELDALRVLARGQGWHCVASADRLDEVVVSFDALSPDRAKVWFRSRGRTDAIVFLKIAPTLALRQSDCVKTFCDPPRDAEFVGGVQEERRRSFWRLAGLLDGWAMSSGFECRILAELLAAQVRLLRLIETISEQEYDALMKFLKTYLPDSGEP